MEIACIQERASQLFQSGQYSDAIELYQQGIDQLNTIPGTQSAQDIDSLESANGNSDVFMLHFNIALCLNKLSQHEQCITHASLAITTANDLLVKTDNTTTTTAAAAVAESLQQWVSKSLFLRAKSLACLRRKNDAIQDLKHAFHLCSADRHSDKRQEIRMLHDTLLGELTAEKLSRHFSRLNTADHENFDSEDDDDAPDSEMPSFDLEETSANTLLDQLVVQPCENSERDGHSSPRRAIRDEGVSQQQDTASLEELQEMQDLIQQFYKEQTIKRRIHSASVSSSPFSNSLRSNGDFAFIVEDDSDDDDDDEEEEEEESPETRTVATVESDDESISTDDLATDDLEFSDIDSDVDE